MSMRVVKPRSGLMLCERAISSVFLRFRFRPDREPFRVAREGVPLALPLGQGFPFEQIIQILIRRTDGNGPEACLTDAVLVPDFQRVFLEARQHIGEPASGGAVNTQFMDHENVS